MTFPAGVRGVLLDIEGTTTPIAFVHETLFPFARARLDAACAGASSYAVVEEAVALLRREHDGDAADPRRPAFGNGAPYAHFLMDLDRKSTGLKALQGAIWDEGYRSGALRAPLFDDVPRALRAWRAAGVRLRIFSSGSVLAQRLLFAHTDHGDLSGMFEGFHDTTTGPKREPGSYRRIADAFDLPPGALLFLSDVVAELDAARAAGYRTGLAARPGNAPATPGTHPVHDDLAALLPA